MSAREPSRADQPLDAEELLALGDDETRRAVMVAVWDRSGLGPKSTVVTETKAHDLSGLTDEELAEANEAASRRLRELSLSKREGERRTNEEPLKTGPDVVH